jgi:hypothetical protein
LFLAIGAVYHRHMRAHETELDAERGNPQDQCPSFRNTCRPIGTPAETSARVSAQHLHGSGNARLW